MAISTAPQRRGGSRLDATRALGGNARANAYPIKASTVSQTTAVPSTRPNMGPRTRAIVVQAVLFFVVYPAVTVSAALLAHLSGADWPTSLGIAVATGFAIALVGTTTSVFVSIRRDRRHRLARR